MEKSLKWMCPEVKVGKALNGNNCFKFCRWGQNLEEPRGHPGEDGAEA